jgi:hypothetical protein
MPGFYGKRAKTLVGTGNPPATGIDFQSDTLRKHRSVDDLKGMSGTFSRFAARARPGLQPIAGQLALYPTPVDLAVLLPLMLHGTPSGTSYPLADPVSLTTFNHWRLMGSKIYKFAGCGLGRWTLSARQGGALLLTADVLGQTLDNTAAAATFPVFSFDQTTKPFKTHELALTIASNPYQLKAWSLSVDWAVDADRFFNSQTLQGIFPTDRVITVSHDLPFGDAEAAYGLDQDAGVAVTAAFVSGGTSLTLSTPAVQYEDDSAVVPGREEVMLPLTGIARVAVGQAALSELAVTLDSTP